MRDYLLDLVRNDMHDYIEMGRAIDHAQFPPVCLSDIPQGETRIVDLKTGKTIWER